MNFPPLSQRPDQGDGHSGKLRCQSGVGLSGIIVGDDQERTDDEKNKQKKPLEPLRGKNCKGSQDSKDGEGPYSSDPEFPFLGLRVLTFETNQPAQDQGNKIGRASCRERV